jgi:hypothetical protein
MTGPAQTDTDPGWFEIIWEILRGPLEFIATVITIWVVLLLIGAFDPSPPLAIPVRIVP